MAVAVPKAPSDFKWPEYISILGGDGNGNSNGVSAKAPPDFKWPAS